LTLRAHAAGVRGNTSYVAVEVADTGSGMSETTRRRCLDPFFTTKGERGTGLGLAMVYGIAQRHNAEIEIASELGQGTTMRLLFPVASAAQIGLGGDAESSPVLTRLRILVVDDDPLILKSLRDALETDGHLITTANGGKEGIETFERSIAAGEAFAVVITDLGMPYVDGRKVSAAVKACSPHTPVVLLTGWGQRLTEQGDVPPHVDRVLNKPPKLRELRVALRELVTGNDLAALVRELPAAGGGTRNTAGARER
jgi:CheY-like chemotaxis protein